MTFLDAVKIEALYDARLLLHNIGKALFDVKPSCMVQIFSGQR
jgi:hypothetical protein